MKKIMYRTGLNYNNELIQEFEIIKESEHSVWFYNKRNKEERSFKKTNYHQFWKTKHEAKEYLRDKTLKEIERLQNNLNKEIDKLAKIQAI